MGEDTISGNLGGLDTLEGGQGDDAYYIRNTTDTVVERADEGIDQVLVLANSHKMNDNVEIMSMMSRSKSTGYGNDQTNGIFGSDGINSIFGMGGDDLLNGFGGNDTLTGGKGDDVLSGGSGDDLYIYNPDDGWDMIADGSGGKDTLLIHGATESQIWFKMVGKDLSISVIGRDGEVSVSKWAQSASYQVDLIKLDNGKVLASSQVSNLVNAMASLTPPPAGQTTLPANYQTALAGAIAQNWVA